MQRPDRGTSSPPQPRPADADGPHREAEERLARTRDQAARLRRWVLLVGGLQLALLILWLLFRDHVLFLAR